MRTIVVEQYINASPEQAFRAFTNATSLREWLCDIATVNPVEGGRFYIAWNAGFYACGEYKEVKAAKRVAFSWLGRGDPGPSKVRVSFEIKDGGTKVSLTHDGLGMGEKWDSTSMEIQNGWEVGLENLASVLETGEDLRFTRRPMLGITLNDFTPEQAKKLGIPVTEGVRVDDLVEGMGAQAAGLQASDVIVEMGGQAISSYADLPEALRGKHAGDTVEVIFYRGSEKMQVEMQLSARPIPEIPASTISLADILRKRYEDLDNEIQEFFKSVSDEEADYKLSPDEWSAKEVLAHLVQGERFQQFYLAELYSGFERWSDDFGGNLDASVQATVAAFPTIDDLLTELQRSFTETVTFIEKLPKEFTENKGSFWRFASGALESPYHFYTHMEQMRKSITAAGEH